MDKGHDARRAFTFIELIVIMLIIGILAAVVAQFGFNESPDYAKVQGCAHSLRAAMRNLQSRARSTHTPHRISFSTTSHTYTTSVAVGDAWQVVESNQEIGCYLVSANFFSSILIYNEQGLAFEGAWSPEDFSALPLLTDRTIVVGVAPGHCGTASGITATVNVNMISGLVE